MRALCVLILVFAFSISAETLWQDINMYTPAASVRQGDTVVVQVDDASRLRYTLNVENSNTSSVNSTPDTTITGFLPSVNSNEDISHTNGVNVESRGNLSLSIGASIGALQNDGTFPIQGTKTYVFNGVATTIGVAGRINPADMNGTAIRSESVINFQLRINTTTQGLDLDLARQLEEDESATADLTEEEKQQIITDYLERIIDELSK